MATRTESRRRSRTWTCALSIAVVAATAAACTDGDQAATGTTTTGTSTVARPAAGTVQGLLRLGRPIVLAHAGGDDVHPHDTPYGFVRSAADGVDVLDMDVQLSRDGVLVIQHDDTVDRTTNGTGAVASLTYEQLHALDAAHWFTRGCTCTGRPAKDYVLRGVRTGDQPAPAGTTPDVLAISRFPDVARRFPHHVLNIEIKGRAPAALPAAAELAREVRVLGRTGSVVVTSFDDAVVDAFASAAPGVAITPGLGATAAYVQAGTLPAAGRRILQIPPAYEGYQVLTPDLVARAHRDGLVLWIWPDEARWETGPGYRQLLDLGVDGVNAADPATAVRVLRSRTGTGSPPRRSATPG